MQNKVFFMLLLKCEISFFRRKFCQSYQLNQHEPSSPAGTIGVTERSRRLQPSRGSSGLDQSKPVLIEVLVSRYNDFWHSKEHPDCPPLRQHCHNQPHSQPGVRNATSGNRQNLVIRPLKSFLIRKQSLFDAPNGIDSQASGRC